LQFANGAFLEEAYEVKPHFKNVLEKDFQSTVESVRFSNPTAAAGQINSWVADHTHDKIQNVLLPGKEISRYSVKHTSVNGCNLLSYKDISFSLARYFNAFGLGQCHLLQGIMEETFPQDEYEK
jgi:hypothetical protein